MGSAYVHKYSIALARGSLPKGMGQIPRQGNGWSHDVLGVLINETLAFPGAQAAKGDGEKDKFKINQLATVQRLNHLMNTVLGARD